jgi:hypothetical protein
MAAAFVLLAAAAAAGVGQVAGAATRAHATVRTQAHATVRTQAHATVRTTAATGRPCGTLTPRAVHPAHVIWIVMENRSYSQVIGAPYIASLAAHCGVATNYHNVSHPSLPNYLAMTSGQSTTLLPKTDCATFCPVSGSSIFSETSSWRVFAESMPGTCVKHDARPYVVHHTAAPYYSAAAAACARNDLPLTSLNLAALPSFSLIVPNVSNDMHETSSSVAKGDSWLRTHLGAILASPAYRSGSTVVFLTWDEGGLTRSTNSCATNTTDPGCHVALLVMSPYIHPGMRWTGLANHYSLLRATERLLGLPYLQQAATAPSLNAAFGL